jgi:ubiquinone/menaquinone biosynthesis C-methylase UbiE/predicted  nucleic acid-binding Zn-ribbon protein
MAEFTGERIIPGKVDIDLFNEHISRYHFASRLCRFKKVIDLGCGSGYGSAELARVADHVTGVDIDPATIEEARATYPLANLEFQTASVAQLPFDDGYFHTGICFEVIEHLASFRDLLKEARRVISPNGAFVVSTPNKLYYEETRKQAGPNPFHTHEFTFEEFQAALSEFFPHQTYFVQNHSSSLVFLPLQHKAGAEIKIENETADPVTAHFFIAVCAAKPLLGNPSYIFIPKTANVLAERERHIARLEGELRTKDEWLEASKSDLAQLVEQHRALKAELEAKNQWALQQNERVAQAHAAVQRMESELATQNAAAQKLAADYESRLNAVESDYAHYVAWAQQNETQLNEQFAQLSAHIQKLDAEQLDAIEKVRFFQSKIDELEKTVVERTLWAQSLDAQRSILEERLGALESSRWTKVGRAIGLGPAAKYKS